MGIEAKMLMHDTIDGEALFMPPKLNNYRSSLIRGSDAAYTHSAHISTKDYLMIITSSDIRILRKSDYSIVPNQLNIHKLVIAEATYTLFGPLTSYYYSPYRRSYCVSPIGTENQIVAFYEGGAIACYNITEEGLVLQNTQVYCTSGGGLIAYSVYNDKILIAASYEASSVNDNSSSSSKYYYFYYGYSAYIGTLTSDGVLVETLKAPSRDYSSPGSVHTDSFSYGASCYYGLHAVIYNENEGYVGICVDPPGDEGQNENSYTSIMKHVELSTKKLTTASIQLPASHYCDWCSGSVRTPSYVFCTSSNSTSVAINSSGELINPGLGGEAAIYTNLPSNSVLLSAAEGTSLAVLTENEDGLLTTKTLLSEEPLSMYLGDYACIYETVNNISYASIFPVSEENTKISFDPSRSKGCIYTCPEGKITQLTSLHIVNDIANRDQSIILYADGKLITRFVVNGAKTITYANCPLVFSPGTKLEFRAIRSLAPIHITMFGIEEDM